MSKELELLNEVEKSFLYGTAGQYKEQLKTEYIEPIKQALTELEELREKNTPMRPNEILKDFYDYEPSVGICKCGKQVDSSQRYCDSCGQALDWSDSE